MRSIRLSLLVYFGAMLIVAMGAVSLLVYQVTSDSLRAKEESVRDLLQARFDRRSQSLRERFDEELLRRAHTLASLACSQRGKDPFHRFFVLGLLTGGAAPLGQLLVPTWIGQGMDSPLVARMYAMEKIQFADDIVPPSREGRETDYFQIFSQAGEPIQASRSLEDQEFTLPEDTRESLQLFEETFDDVEVRPGVKVRRVTLFAPVTRTRYGFPSSFRDRPPPFPRESRDRSMPSREGRAGSMERNRPGPGFFFSLTPPSLSTAPAIFIQYARDTREREAMIDVHRQEFESDLADRQAESQAALAALRNRLILVGVVTFAGTVIGVVWLVRRGLRPVDRIADAVSRVSERNFQLPLTEAEVPKEITPIVAKLREALESLERAFLREKQAAADISHELRTPISALMATIQVCLKKARTPEDYRETLVACSEIGGQLRTLVERLLVLARIDAGVDAYRPETIDLPELAGQCVALVRPLAEAKGLDLQFERNGPLVARTDPEKLREVLNNLLANAIQYNRPQGRVVMRVDRCNGDAVFEVRDTGVGIPPAAREHLFERFYRADPSRSSDTVHAGLGLAIVKGYVDLMGGRIDVESTEGQGALFRVFLPLESEAKPNRSSRRPASGSMATLESRKNA